MEECIRLRNKYCDFEPPKSFLDDIARYRDAKITDDIDVGFDHPLFHASMDERTLKAYISWRTKVQSRIIPKAD